VSGNWERGIPKVSKGRFNSFQSKLEITYLKTNQIAFEPLPIAHSLQRLNQLS